MSKDLLWRLEPHVCRKCFGRVLSRCADTVGVRVYRCSDCGHEVEADNPAEICCCGVKIRKSGRDGSKHGGSLVDAGLRCIKNPARTNLLPSEVVAAEGVL